MKSARLMAMCFSMLCAAPLFAQVGTSTAQQPQRDDPRGVNPQQNLYRPPYVPVQEDERGVPARFDGKKSTVQLQREQREEEARRARSGSDEDNADH